MAGGAGTAPTPTVPVSRWLSHPRGACVDRADPETRSTARAEQALDRLGQEKCVRVPADLGTLDSNRRMGYRTRTLSGLRQSVYRDAMASIRLGSIALDCADPLPLATFWADLLGGEVAFTSDAFVAIKTDRIWLAATRVEDYTPPTWPEAQTPKQMHLDLAVENLKEAEEQATALGAVRATSQPAPERYIVLFDPAGHPFCLSTQIPE